MRHERLGQILDLILDQISDRIGSQIGSQIGSRIRYRIGSWQISERSDCWAKETGETGCFEKPLCMGLSETKGSARDARAALCPIPNSWMTLGDLT